MKKKKSPRAAVVKRKMERSVAKERRKVAEALTNLQLTELPAFKAIDSQLKVTIDAHNKLGKIVAQNAQAFGDAFVMADMLLHVTQKVIEDDLAGELQTYTNGDGDTKHIDWVGYKKYYWQCMELEKFFLWLHSLKGPETTEDEAEKPVVFGGE